MITAIAFALLLAIQDEPAPESQEDAKARPVFEKAMAFVAEGKKAEKPEEREKAFAQAVAGLREVVKDHTKSSLYGISWFNIGVITADHLGRHEDAIKEFKALIAGDVNDKDPTGMLMSPFRNYRYNAWRMIATSQEKLKQPGRSLVALFSMRDAYVTDCGTCTRNMLSSWRDGVKKVLPAIAPGGDPAAMEGALKDEQKAEEFLAACGKALAAAGKKADAVAVLKVIVEEFPGTESAKDAAKAIGAPK